MKKIKITALIENHFFLKIGAIIFIDFENGYVYSEDMKQCMYLDTALSLGINGEILDGEIVNGE